MAPEAAPSTSPILILDVWRIGGAASGGTRIPGGYRIGPDSGRLTLLADDFEAPNDLCLSPDETTLFVNDSERGHIRAFRILPNGRLAGGEIWASTVGDGPGSPDGMKLDHRGNLYCCGPGGVHVFASDGCCLGVLRIPEAPANLAFGGPDLRDLFVTAESSLRSAAAQCR